MDRGPLDEFQDMISNIPVFTRNIIFSTLALSLCCQFKIISPTQVILNPEAILKGEIWRLFTCICLGSGFGLVMHCFFLYQNLHQLETSTFNQRKGDLFVMLVFVILNLNLFGFFMGFPVLTNAFSMSIVYIWAMANPDSIVNFMFGMQFKASCF